MIWNSLEFSFHKTYGLHLKQFKWNYDFTGGVRLIPLLPKKCPYSELFWSAFSRIRTEYGEILRISLYSVRMWERADQNNSEYGHFLGSACSRLTFYKRRTFVSEPPTFFSWLAEISPLLLRGLAPLLQRESNQYSTRINI